MGKYDHVIRERGLTELPVKMREGGQKYQDKVNYAKNHMCICGLLEDDSVHIGVGKTHDYEEFKERTPQALVTMLADLRREEDAKEAARKEASVRVEAIEQLLKDVYLNEGITDLTLRGIGNVRMESAPYFHVRDGAAYDAWCRENGFEPQMHLHPSTTQSVFKEKLLENVDPPECLGVYVKSKVVLTREK